jgi:hypothetical protein
MVFVEEGTEGRDGVEGGCGFCCLVASIQGKSLWFAIFRCYVRGYDGARCSSF